MRPTYRTLLTTLQDGACRALSTSAEVDQITSNAEQLAAHHHRHFGSPWDIPRLLCAVLRAQLNARLTNTEMARALPLSSLLRLLLASWEMCPLVSLPPPADASLTRTPPLPLRSLSCCRIDALIVITPHDMERVAAELDTLREVSEGSFSSSSLSAASAPSASSSPSSSASNSKQSTDTHHTALSVMMSLLSYFHVIAAESCGDDTDDGFQRVSATVWHCVHQWTASPSAAAAGARVVAVSAWMGTVLRRALRVATSTALLDTVAWLESFLSASLYPSMVAAAPQGALPIAALNEYWARLHVRVCQHVCTSLHRCQTLLKERWTSGVAPVLRRALAHEPPLLSGASLQAFDLGDSLEDLLGVLVDEVQLLHGDASDSEEEAFTLLAGAAVLSPLLQLSAVQRHLDGTCVRLAPFITDQTYTPCVRPVVAVSLRWGLVDTAQTLLAWASDGLDDHGKQWRQRLQRLAPDSNAPMGVGEKLCEPSCDVDQATQRGKEMVGEDVFSGRSYTSWMEEEQQSHSPDWLTARHTLDALVRCDDVQQLRLHCDFLLRCPAPWSTQVLADPFAAYFVLRSLAQLAGHFLDVGDPPMARFYTAVLGQLLPRYLCPTFLSSFLSLLQRLAHTLSAYDVSVLDYSVASSAHGKSVRTWRRVKTFLDKATLPAPLRMRRNAAAGVHPATYTTGMALTARQDYWRYCAALRSSASFPPRKETSADKTGGSWADLCCTAVEIQYTPDNGGTLLLQRTELGDSLKSAPQSCVETRDAPPFCDMACCHRVGESMRACAADMTDILRCNRQQLIQGSNGCADGVGEKALCTDNQGGLRRSSCSSTTESNTEEKATPADPLDGLLSTDAALQLHQQRKKEWWKARYELDSRIGAVVASLQRTLGPLRVLLAGRPSDALTFRLSALATRFAETCVQLRGGRLCPPPDALQRATTSVLLGGPSLWSTARDDADAQPTCLYSPPQHSTCSACAATLRNARTTLLVSIVCVGQSSCAHHERAHAPCASADVDSRDQTKWESLLVDSSVTAAVDALAVAALDAFYHECARCVASDVATTPSHSHLDLLLHPRAHMYLILAGELHGLPWEGLDVCRDRSTSRVPSLDYLRRSHASLRGSSASLRRTLLYRDGDALLNHTGGVADLINQHPAWEVVYGETLYSAAAAQKAGGPLSPSLLLRRVVGSRTDGDHLDTYVYAGHRGGEQLISRGSLYEWLPPSTTPQPSLVLLMGCSSARMCGNAIHDSFGLPFAYLSAGVSCVGGCLWDVTDGDVDRLTCRLLDFAATSSANATTVGESLAVARRACKLRCLTGLSTVLYGLNLPIDSEA